MLLSVLVRKVDKGWPKFSHMSLATMQYSACEKLDIGRNEMGQTMRYRRFSTNMATAVLGEQIFAWTKFLTKLAQLVVIRSRAESCLLENKDAPMSPNYMEQRRSTK